MTMLMTTKWRRRAMHWRKSDLVQLWNVQCLGQHAQPCGSCPVQQGATGPWSALDADSQNLRHITQTFIQFDGCHLHQYVTEPTIKLDMLLIGSAQWQRCSTAPSISARTHALP
jgi:hypothetical protein